MRRQQGIVPILVADPLPVHTWVANHGIAMTYPCARGSICFRKAAMSMLVQCSISLPSFTRKMSMNSHSTMFPLAWVAPQLSPMGSAECLAGGDKITFRELVVDLHSCVGEPVKQLAVEGLESCCRPISVLRDGLPLRGIVVGEVRMEDLIREPEVVLVLTHVDEPGDDLLVVLSRHGPYLPSEADPAPQSRYSWASMV